MPFSMDFQHVEFCAYADFALGIMKEDLNYSADQQRSYLWISFVFSRIILSNFL